jgi:cytochrome c553
MFRRHLSAIFAVAFLAFTVTILTVPAYAQDIAAKAQVCAGCHGVNGVPTDPKTIPVIWGQQASYLYKELHDYHSGARDNPIMTPIAQGLSLEDLRQIANYFAAKSWPAGHTTPANPPAGITDKLVQCRLCHQANFEGGEPAPRLAGLSFDYLLAAMNSFADGTRTNNLDMPGFMKVLSESERDAMARYLAGL